MHFGDSLGGGDCIGGYLPGGVDVVVVVDLRPGDLMICSLNLERVVASDFWPVVVHVGQTRIFKNLF